MNKKEIEGLLLTHYENESQTLTSDSETNLLKLKEIAGLLSDTDRERWQQIKEVFNKNNKFAGIDQNNQTGQVIAQLAELSDNLLGIRKAISKK